jgi:hypothetical protein
VQVIRAVVAVVVAFVVSLFVAIAPVGAAVTLTVTPSEGLHDGDPVTVTEVGTSDCTNPWTGGEFGTSGPCPSEIVIATAPLNAEDPWWEDTGGRWQVDAQGRYIANRHINQTQTCGVEVRCAIARFVNCTNTCWYAETATPISFARAPK